MPTKAAKRPVKKTTKAAKKPVKRVKAAKQVDPPKSAKTVLVLRTCNADMTSHGGFKWPTKGPVECKDWDAKPACGNGLHGLLWGEGQASLMDWGHGAKWLAVEVDETSIVDLGGKVKFPRGVVVCCGDRKAATDYIIANGGQGKKVHGGTATAGDGGTATAGDGGTATAGYGGTATAGDGGTATAGDGGTATAGYGGTATAGDGGTATAGYGGTATAGYGGAITILFFDSRTGSYRRIVGAVDGQGLKAGVKYKLDDKGEFVEVK